MLQDAEIDRAARILLDHWNAASRFAALPAEVQPADRREAYAIARRFGELRSGHVAGWKIAATSAAGQRHINVDGPLAGRIYADRLLPPGRPVPFVNNNMKVAEAEFAFRFGRALPPRAAPYGRDEVAAAVSALHLSIEIPDSRYEDFTRVGAGQLIADTACASYLVLGPPVAANWRALDLASQKVVGLRNGEKVAEGSGANVLGHPLAALTWLVNEVSVYCGGIEADQFVTTGTCIVPVAIASGDRVAADYGALGALEAVIG